MAQRVFPALFCVSGRLVALTLLSAALASAQAQHPQATPKVTASPSRSAAATTKPQQTRPQQVKLQQSKPQPKKPTQAKPIANKPTTPKPSVPKPSTPKPAAPKPLPTKADPYHLNLPTSSPRLGTLQQRLEAQKQLKAAQQQKLAHLQAAIGALSVQQKAALKELNDLGAQVAQGRNRQQDLADQIAQAKDELLGTQAQLDIMTGQVRRLESDVRQMMLGLYRQRSGQYLEVVNQASSLSDLLIRSRYANMGGQHNVAVVEQLRLQRQDLQAQQQKQLSQSQKLQALYAQQQSELSRLHAAQARQQQLIASLKQTQAGQQALALQTQAQQAATAQNINATIGKLIDERNNIEMQRRARIEAERVRRAEELRRIREAQERARKEAERLAALRRAQAEARARAAQAKAQAQARALAEARRQRAQALAQERSRLQQRQQRLEAQQQQAAVELAPLPPASGPLGFPLPGGTITQGFSEGSPWTVLQAPAGTQAAAALGGNVLAVTNYASLGWVVLVDSGNLITAYLGLSDTQVSAGQHVERGAAIGTIGGSPIFGEGHMAFQVNRVSGGGRTPVPPSF